MTSKHWRVRIGIAIGIGVGIGIERDRMRFAPERVDVSRAAIEPVGWAYCCGEGLTRLEGGGVSVRGEPGGYGAGRDDTDSDTDPDADATAGQEKRLPGATPDESLPMLSLAATVARLFPAWAS